MFHYWYKNYKQKFILYGYILDGSKSKEMICLHLIYRTHVKTKISYRIKIRYKCLKITNRDISGNAALSHTIQRIDFF